MSAKANLNWSMEAIQKEAFERGVKTGKRVLDKIIAEIEALNPVDYGSMCSYETHRGASDMKSDVLRIIDKYEESEE